MKITSTGIENGYFKDIFGGHSRYMNENQMPTYSIPLKILDTPQGVQSYAAVLYDLDAYEVTKGFIWIHWVLANLTMPEVLENASQTSVAFVQGVNSSHSPMAYNQDKGTASHYGGMKPRGRDHNYVLKVYALDTILDLESGFYLNQLYDQMEEHIITTAKLTAKYRQYH
ncbi:YbhB/YbcL family Raf kinase inhibitor-like protein [Weissella coleopterorum]|uniref:YbhB/YbcL family Raf kinase inhibitor-like protein n=1 Tax=Weissella coleopterorum TaxID=2714949 RepID=A0A6G8AYR6_9LACO|nr:YbhB/YbcL family Raf kinase inhibitor-like protein [Weissella coleopterorum]QIL50023.1 YbhB/YbcL family Raf kinase inhibitor-like protein [Weissella coleopterorum]